jgi:hypothetical protein
MATCEVCENEYDKAFEVIVAGKHHTFDSFECGSTRWRQSAHTATAGSWGMAWKPMDKSSAAFIARVPPAKQH